MANALRRYKEEHDALYSSQMGELDAASMAQNDFDLAYRLQLEEALQASREEQQRPGPSHPHFIAHSPEDRSLAFSFQNLELSRSHQQAADLHRSTLESERLHQELRLRAHDAKFARTLNDLNDSDWDSHGDLCEEPFESDIENEVLPTFKVYVSSVVSSESPSASAAIGAVVMDSNDNVMTEIKKPLESGVGKAVADYMALIAGLEVLVTMRLQHVDAFIDSVLIYNQVTRKWRVRSQRLQVLCSQVMELAQKFEQFHANLIPRSENSSAVILARGALNLPPPSKTEEGKEAAEVRETCPICWEAKRMDEIFQVSGCFHAFCLSCIVQHAEVKIQAGQVPVRCPHVSCTQTLSLSQCHSILSQKWFELCNKRIIEVNMPEAERVYCPFPKCSALMNKKVLLAGNDAASTSLTSITPSRCMECFRLFCAECRVPWHSSMSCQQYQKLPPNLRDAEDAKVYQLAEHQKWQRCKKCRRMIELAEGCYHITCRCGYEFCYLCGEPWKNKRQTCRCRLWDEGFLLEEPLEVSDDDDEWESSEEISDDDYEDSEDFNDLNTRVLVEVSAPVHNPYYKTRLCKFWERGCFWGENCKFAHGVSELRQPALF